MITSRKRSDGFPEPIPSPPARRPSHRGHGWVMVVCLPMIAVAVVLVATGVASGAVLVAAAVCALMMALMMRGMGEDPSRR